MAPGIGALESQTVAEPASKSCLQSVVGGLASRNKSSDRIAESSVDEVCRFDVRCLQCEQVIQTVRQSIQRCLIRSLGVRRQSRRGSHDRCQVDDVLHWQVNSASAHIVDFGAVILPESMLHAKVPINRIRILLLVRKPVRSIRDRVSLAQDGDAAAATGRKAAVRQEVRSEWSYVWRGQPSRDVLGRTDLRRDCQASYVVVKSVVSHAKATPD